MKKYIVGACLALSLSFVGANAADDFCDTSLTSSELIGASNSLNDSMDLSAALLQNSKAILDLSNSLVAAGSTANTEYVEAMLQLSKDIGEMADRILDMSDNILEMADKIGEMSDRILETQRIQSKNVSLTQSNLLKAQRNFLYILR
jgi:methyl-accepting chemotaxis protein